MSRALHLAEQLISRRSVTPEDAGYLIGAQPSGSSTAWCLTQYQYLLMHPETTLVGVSPLAAATISPRREVPAHIPRPEYVDKPRPERFVNLSIGLVPISLLWHEQTRLEGAPVLLYGYGSYGHAIPAGFSSNSLSLVNRGFVYAIAHIRGGKDKGYAWYEQGKLMHKKNTFEDFVHAAEHLCELGFTEPGNITIHGGSAGGMLVGAAVNMRPELFKAVVAQVPFVDVLNTMLDATLPLTTSEYIEWGNPNEPAAFDYIRQYSPYDNVRPQAYPAMLLHASLNDSQVPYWEAAKLAAKLRELKTDDNPVLLKTNLGAGHGGASGRYDAMRETAFTYAFLLWQWGKLPAPAEGS